MHDHDNTKRFPPEHHYSVHSSPPFLQGGGEGGVSLQPNFQKGGAWQDLNFKRGLLGKRGVTFFLGGLQLSYKNELKSETFSEKKFITKNIFLCHKKEFKLGNFTKEFSYF